MHLFKLCTQTRVCVCVYVYNVFVGYRRRHMYIYIRALNTVVLFDVFSLCH